MATCPANSITYNQTFCACLPGYLLNQTNNRCSLFTANSTIYTDNGVDYYALSFPETIFSFDTIKKLTQSQAVFLEATLVILLSWLAFCFFLRFIKPGDGRNIWFKIRWWISRLDICFATRHWLDDQKVVIKRKTELGGTFSIASWILFIGLFAALLYQIISKRTIEVHNVRATNAPDLASFTNDMEFNITTISSMSCSNLRGLGTLVTGNPGFIDQRDGHLSNFVDYSCWNTSLGPTITFKCSKCQVNADNMYISWQFVDLRSAPAAAVGFQFNFTAKNHAYNKHISFVSGTLKNASISDYRPVTFRGKDPNILKFNLFPRLYHNLNDLRLIQPLFHEFLPGSLLREATLLQTSLETSTDGLINTTLYINYLSSYIVEIDNQSILGPVSFLADLGGLFCTSIGIFFYLLVQCEYRIKKLRNEGITMRRIRSKLKAQEHWNKLRKYVMYTWGCRTLDEKPIISEQGSSCMPRQGSIRKSRSSQKRMDSDRSIIINSKVTLPSTSVKNTIDGHTSKQGVPCSTGACALKSEGRSSDSKGECPPKGDSRYDRKQHSVGLSEGVASWTQLPSLTDDNAIPLPPPLEFSAGSEGQLSDIQKNLQHLYEYNIILREKFLATQSLLHTLASKSSNGPSENQT